MSAITSAVGCVDGSGAAPEGSVLKLKLGSSFTRVPRASASAIAGVRPPLSRYALPPEIRSGSVSFPVK